MKEKRINRRNATNILKPIISKSKILLDIGVQKGKEISSFLEWSPNIQIFGFEPNPDLFSYLQKGRPNCIFYNLAISNKDDDIDFHISDHSGDSSSLREPTELQTRKYREHPIKVQSSKLDTWYKKSGLEIIDFIWSDIEGSERELIEGGKETLKNTKYFYTEYTEKEYYKGQALLPEILEMMKDDFEIEAILCKMSKDRTSWFHAGDILFKNKNYRKINGA